MTARQERLSPSHDPAELAKFAALADEWWDPEGKFAPLHRFNPVRLAFIREALIERFARDAGSLTPFAGLGILDVGCGGGLLSEPMARLGGAVTGIDAVARNVEIARQHAADGALAIDYRCVPVEDLVREGERFDVVLNMEVVEHVGDVGAFLGDCAHLVAPGGVMIVATLNRTAKAFARAIVGAEYVLGWLPRGTHNWRKFVRPSELVRGLEAGGLELVELAGMVFDPLAWHWRIDRRDLAVNYVAVATRPA